MSTGGLRSERADNSGSLRCEMAASHRTLELDQWSPLSGTHAEHDDAGTQPVRLFPQTVSFGVSHGRYLDAEEIRGAEPVRDQGRADQFGQGDVEADAERLPER